MSDDGSSGRHSAGGHGTKGSFWACSAGKADKIGWGVWEEGSGVVSTVCGLGRWKAGLINVEDCTWGSWGKIRPELCWAFWAVPLGNLSLLWAGLQLVPDPVYLSGFGQELRSHCRCFFNIGIRSHHLCWKGWQGQRSGKQPSHWVRPRVPPGSAVIWTVGAAATELSVLRQVVLGVSLWGSWNSPWNVPEVLAAISTCSYAPAHSCLWGVLFSFILSVLQEFPPALNWGRKQFWLLCGAGMQGDSSQSRTTARQRVWARNTHCRAVGRRQHFCSACLRGKLGQEEKGQRLGGSRMDWLEWAGAIWALRGKWGSLLVVLWVLVFQNLVTSPLISCYCVHLVLSTDGWQTLCSALAQMPETWHAHLWAAPPCSIRVFLARKLVWSVKKLLFAQMIFIIYSHSLYIFGF